MATHIDTNTCKMDWKTSYLKCEMCANWKYKQCLTCITCVVIVVKKLFKLNIILRQCQ